MNLKYDKKKWKEIGAKHVNTLQFFITNKCNLKCKACFYAHNIGKEEISFEEYRRHLSNHMNRIDKVVLLGGEPTLYKDIVKLIDYNTRVGLKTTIYTNGANLSVLEGADLSKTKIRLGVYGAYKSEKPLAKVQKTNVPVTVVYMLRKNNVNELMKTAKMAEKKFNCKSFFISSIRDITQTQDFWKDTKDTLSFKEYYKVVQDFIKNYEGTLEKIHVSKRTVIIPGKKFKTVSKCRFGNIFPDGKKIICPLDISRKLYSKKLTFGERPCNKHTTCIMAKVVLQKNEAA
ncbi:MAG: radical SAM protein [Nanoarchaeota archaeon]|nr:radical SAM protein [Nanoarchaeota archaeon]